MEQAYDAYDRHFVYNHVNLKEYFHSYSHLLMPYMPRDSKMVKDVMLAVLKISDIEDFEGLSTYCSLQKYVIPEEPKPLDVECLMKHPGLYDPPAATPEGEKILKTLQILAQQNDDHESVITSKCSNCKWMGKGLRVMDLKPWKHFALTFRVYHPFKHMYGARSHRPPRCSQEIMVLGHQTLDCLRDKIICANDLSPPGDLSDIVDQVPVQKAKEIYPSGLFFIEDTFFIDMRHSGSKDYSKTVKEWAKARSLKIHAAKSIPMNEAVIQDLSICLGYPYLYQHQGNCEHIILISDARLLHLADSQSSGDYPVLLSMSSQNSKYCMICGHYVARWICQNSNRLPFSVCYMCENCFKSFNYKKGKKIGSFTAYQYADRSAIM